MADVFISYHEKTGGALAGLIADELNIAGISCWCARRNLPPGSDFSEKIPQQIDKCRLFLLLLNHSACYSRHVQNELGIAFRRLNKGENIVILPLEIGKIIRPKWGEYYLIHTQSLKITDLNEGNIDEWVKRIVDRTSRVLRGQERNPPAVSKNRPTSAPVMYSPPALPPAQNVICNYYISLEPYASLDFSPLPLPPAQNVTCNYYISSKPYASVTFYGHQNNPVSPPSRNRAPALPESIDGPVIDVPVKEARHGFISFVRDVLESVFDFLYDLVTDIKDFFDTLFGTVLCVVLFFLKLTVFFVLACVVLSIVIAIFSGSS